MTCASESTILRITSVTALTGLSRATIYRLSGSGKFPASLHLSDHCVGWRQSEVMDWIASRPARGTRKGARAENGDAEAA